jgi:hypothetical protein
VHSSGVHARWICRELGLHVIHPAKHAGSEEVDRRASRDEKLDDRLVPHLGRGLDRRLVPRCAKIQRRWMYIQELAHTCDVAMGISHQLFDHGLVGVSHRVSVLLNLLATGGTKYVKVVWRLLLE